MSKTIEQLKADIVEEFGCHPLFRDLFAELAARVAELEKERDEIHSRCQGRE